MDQRRCRVCEQTKPLTQFRKRVTQRKTGVYTTYSWVCTKCETQRKRRTKYKIPKSYVVPDDCELCGKPLVNTDRGSHFDHDHATGEFRGTICNTCNGVLGFANDSIELLEKAIQYLRRHGK